MMADLATKYTVAGFKRTFLPLAIMQMEDGGRRMRLVNRREDDVTSMIPTGIECVPSDDSRTEVF